MPVVNKGLKELTAKFKKLPSMIDTEKRLALKGSGIKIQREARRDHRYNNPPHMISRGLQYQPSGNLDRSISYEVISKPKYMAMRIFLNPTLTTNKGFNYGLAQHNGMGSGFRLSPISSPYTTTGRNNLEHDWFLYRAYKKELPTLKKNLRNAPTMALRKAGLL